MYIVGGRAASKNGLLCGALLAAGPDSAVSHRAAAELHGFMDGPSPVEISAPRSRANPRGVHVHRPRVLAPDVVEREGLRVTTPARTLVDLCAVLSASHVARLFHEAEVLRLVARSELREVLDRSQGRRGIGKLRRFALVEAHVTRSQLERRFVSLVAAAGMPAPRTNENLLVAGHWFEVDAYWPDERVAVELDSWQFHRTRERFESDRLRDSVLISAGWHPLRFTWRRLRDDPEGVIDAVRAVLDASGPRLVSHRRITQPTSLGAPLAPGLPSTDGRSSARRAPDRL